MGTPMPTPNTTRGAANKELPASKAIANNFVFIFVPPFTTCPEECSQHANSKSLKQRNKSPFNWPLPTTAVALGQPQRLTALFRRAWYTDLEVGACSWA
jgi:hypothetical protein